MKLILRVLTIDFSNRDISLLGLARLGVSFATWCFTIALGVYGFEAHGAAGVGIVALVRFLPAALVSPLVGLLIDRSPRRTVMLGSAVATAVVLLGPPRPLPSTPRPRSSSPSRRSSPSPPAATRPPHAALSPTAGGDAAAALGQQRHPQRDGERRLPARRPRSPACCSPPPRRRFVFGVAAGGPLVGLALVARCPQRPPARLRREGERCRARSGRSPSALRTLAAHPARAARLGDSGAALPLRGVRRRDGRGDGAGAAPPRGGQRRLPQRDLGNRGGGRRGGARHAVRPRQAGAGDRGRQPRWSAPATMLPGIWPHAATAYPGWLAIGIGFVFVEVAAKTLMQRLGSDETLGRVIGSLEVRPPGGDGARLDRRRSSSSRCCMSAAP